MSIGVVLVGICFKKNSTKNIQPLGFKSSSRLSCFQSNFCCNLSKIWKSLVSTDFVQIVVLILADNLYHCGTETVRKNSEKKFQSLACRCCDQTGVCVS